MSTINHEYYPVFTSSGIVPPTESAVEIIVPDSTFALQSSLPKDWSTSGFNFRLYKDFEVKDVGVKTVWAIQVNSIKDLIAVIDETSCDIRINKNIIGEVSIEICDAEPEF